MTEYAIFSDSCCDLPQAVIDKFAVEIMPLRLHIGADCYRIYPDGRELSTDVFYRRVQDGEDFSTAAVPVADFIASMEPVLAEERDILYIAFSAALSETWQNACMAATHLREKYPNRQIVVLDSKSASMGEGLLVYTAAEMQRAGADLKDTARHMEEMIPRLCHWFTLRDLHYLKHGGRISATTAAVGSMLHIMPVLHMDDGGHLISAIKVRGRGASVRALSHRLESTAADIASQTVMISYGECRADAQSLARYIRDAFHPVHIIVNTIDPVIAAHTGPSTLALFFIGSQR